jgi:gas vesicle protein
MNERSAQQTGVGMGMGFLWGALVGAGLALLMAPASGTETRRKLGETARRLRHDVPEKARGLMNQARSAVTQGVKETRSTFDNNETRSVYSEREGA